MTAARVGPRARGQRREYRSPLRQGQAAQTRRAVLDAATRQFGEHGWAGTSMRAVAEDAGVSVETVYAAIGPKAELLRQAIDVAIVGDDEPVALDQRPEFATTAVGDLPTRIEAGAALITAAHERTVGVLRALREGAAGDAALAQRLAQAREGFG
ncbi:MAG: helix-turn-helix domain-containing protein, partial [Nocardioidaceae bacterium]